VRAPGPPSVDPAIEIGGRFHVLVAKHLPHQFVSARVGVEVDLGGEMSELVRSKF
jgi:hypothetical protein